MKRGTLLVVSGFSGAGKGTVLSKVLEKRTDLYYSVSFTTRAPRTGEQDGVNYHFVTREAFQERIDRGEFLEYAEYVGNFYGTSMAVIREKLDQGVDVILEIESQGAAKVRQKMPEAVSLFLVPRPSRNSPAACTAGERTRRRSSSAAWPPPGKRPKSWSTMTISSSTTQ